MGAVAAEHGHLNVLVNNAGISPKLGRGERANAAAALGTNVVGAVGMTEAFGGLLRKGAGAEGGICMLLLLLLLLLLRKDPPPQPSQARQVSVFLFVVVGITRSPPFTTLKSSHILTISVQAPRVIYLSSGLGSMTMASDPTDKYYNLEVTSYRASKAAINMVAVQQAKILGKEDGIKVFAVDPGFRVSLLVWR